jgi:hypothetical protein
MARQADQVQKGAFYFHMAQMLFAFLSYEAYLNFVGHIVASQEWSNERSFFTSNLYQGIKGKLKLIEEKLEFQVDRNTEPYQTVACLEQFRDFISHGKPDYYPVTAAAVKRSSDFPFCGKLDQWVTPEKAARSKSQVLELCRIINQHAKSAGRVKNHRQFGDEPFAVAEQVEWIP